MDSITLYMLAICTKSALCYPLDPPADCTKDKGFWVLVCGKSADG